MEANNRRNPAKPRRNGKWCVLPRGEEPKWLLQPRSRQNERASEQKINQFARYVTMQFGESDSGSGGRSRVECSSRVIREELMDRPGIVFWRAESWTKVASVSNFTAMTNDLRMLRRCLTGCHLCPVGVGVERRKVALVRAMESERDEKGRMMMRAKLIIPADVNDYEPLSWFFLSLYDVSCSLWCIFLRRFPFLRGPSCFLNFDEVHGPEGTRNRFGARYFVKVRPQKSSPASLRNRFRKTMT